jgi:hypothetical protein
MNRVQMKYVYSNWNIRVLAEVNSYNEGELEAARLKTFQFHSLKKKKHALFLIDDCYIKHKILLSNSNR